MSYLRYIAIVILLLAAPLSAHQQKEAITRVLFNPRTGNIEVMHRFLLHDAEHAVKELVDAKADILFRINPSGIRRLCLCAFCNIRSGW